jgi:hypothetical protein
VEVDSRSGRDAEDLATWTNGYLRQPFRSSETSFLPMAVSFGDVITFDRDTGKHQPYKLPTIALVSQVTRRPVNWLAVNANGNCVPQLP